ncbi:MAG: hypothetical protein FWB96_04045 [Defluviitaleaceae bacterium]|nr:hypothetical protein [Defluviitaleaceae bacterium]MCL2262086.1 hypothetical protein [Defluviitaleaceae bacterium]
MRKLIEKPIYMTYEEMEKNFVGKWVLIVNCDYTKHSKLVGGTPVAVADTIFEGQEDGFYDKFKNPMYSPRAYEDFNYDNIPGIFGFNGSLEVEGVTVW